MLFSCSGGRQPVSISTKYPPPTGYPKPYQVFGKWYQPIPDSKGYHERGTASWYGEDFHGKKTSNGETYNMHDMTAAHKTLPLGTIVKVLNLDTNKEIIVRVNDRGPFVKDRIIDLSHEAAKRIGIVGPGTGSVEIAAIGQEVQSETDQAALLDYYSGNFTFQVGSFADKSNAERLKAKLEQKYKNAHINVFDDGNRIYYRVRVGLCSKLEDTAKYEKILTKDGYAGVITIAE
uniref:Probable endolytic peptidoglycan transglycosylase RlpA n=1 Tax=uncultured Desulfobacterium sp. TaxID=201089 RepID=E1YF42_9BACT|nr:RlpA-like lipoprotein [uncultured Desulfobacterium sp.]